MNSEPTGESLGMLARCKACDANAEWTVPDRYTLSAEDASGHRVYPAVCSRCGHVQLFDAPVGEDR
jgi:hypothetical protein